MAIEAGEGLRAAVFGTWVMNMAVERREKAKRAQHARQQPRTSKKGGERGPTSNDDEEHGHERRSDSKGESSTELLDPDEDLRKGRVGEKFNCMSDTFVLGEEVGTNEGGGGDDLDETVHSRREKTGGSSLQTDSFEDGRSVV